MGAIVGHALDLTDRERLMMPSSRRNYPVRSTAKAANSRLNDMPALIHMSQYRPQLRRDTKICCDPYDIHPRRDCKKSTPNTRSGIAEREIGHTDFGITDDFRPDQIASPPNS